MEKVITIRPARREDAPMIAEAVAMAVGYGVEHPLYAVFLELAGREVAQYSYRNSLVAEVDGVVAGAIVGYDGARLEELRRPIYPLLKEHLGEIPHIEDETEAGEYYLDSLGVLPAFRGLGVGGALLNAASERAFAEGHTRVGLIVDFDNPNAERLYTSLGFQRVGEKRFLGHRMWHLQRVKSRYGEPYLGDTKYVAKCRLLQSRYRADILNLPIAPYKGGGKSYFFGNYIADGERSGANFLEEYIFAYAKHRVAHKRPYETIQSDRLFNNLLSSQPMAFNLFCPLRKMLSEDAEAATTCIKRALPDYDIAHIEDVDLEFIPANYEQLTGDRSAMDAIIRYRNSEGKECFIAIETKYSENLGTNEAGKHGRARAVEVIEELGCFPADIVEQIKSNKIRLTQIYRNFLLSEAYAHYNGFIAHSLILSPKELGSTERELKELKDRLTPAFSERLGSLSLESFVDSLIANCPTAYRTVFEQFRERYLTFEILDNLDTEGYLQKQNSL